MDFNFDSQPYFAPRGASKGHTSPFSIKYGGLPYVLRYENYVFLLRMSGRTCLLPSRVEGLGEVWAALESNQQPTD